MEGYQQEDTKFHPNEEKNHHVCVTYDSDEKMDENIETDEHVCILDIEHQENNANYVDANSSIQSYITFQILKEIHDDYSSLPLCYATFEELKKNYKITGEVAKQDETSITTM